MPIHKKNRVIMGLQSAIDYQESYDGNFVILESNKCEVRWYGRCREIFHAYLVDYNPSWRYLSFGFVGDREINLVAVDRFIAKVQAMAKIKGRTYFYHTQSPKAFVVRPAPYWRKTECGRQLFSLLIRCAACYNQKGSIWASLRSYPLSNQIRRELRPFMRGWNQPMFTDYNMLRYYGIVGYLQNNNHRKLWVKPNP